MTFHDDAIVEAAYRPFEKRWLYYLPDLNESPGKQSEFFPHGLSNIAICVVGTGSDKGFSALVSSNVADFHFQSNNKVFPLYSFANEKKLSAQDPLPDTTWEEGAYVRRDAISNAILTRFREVFDPQPTKEDIFYYVYGIFHSPEYKQRFDSDLKKMLPRIPMVRDFWAFAKAGRELAELHLNYEHVPPYPVEQQSDTLAIDPESMYKVQKMHFGKPQKGSGQKADKTTIVYNSHITLKGIPLEAYDYVVNGKPAIEWIMERYQVTKDKASGIVNDPNDWAAEHNDPEYILRLLKSIITVSLETMKIVNSLPALNERQ